MIPAGSKDGGNRTFWGDPVVVTSVRQLPGKGGYKCPMIQKALHSCSSLKILPFTRPEIGRFLIMAVEARTNNIHKDIEWASGQSQEQWTEDTRAKDRQGSVRLVYMWIKHSKTNPCHPWSQSPSETEKRRLQNLSAASHMEEKLLFMEIGVFSSSCTHYSSLLMFNFIAEMSHIHEESAD